MAGNKSEIIEAIEKALDDAEKSGRKYTSPTAVFEIIHGGLWSYRRPPTNAALFERICDIAFIDPRYVYRIVGNTRRISRAATVKKIVTPALGSLRD